MTELRLKQYQEVITPEGPALAQHWVITEANARLLCVSLVGEDPKTHRPIIKWRYYSADQVQLSHAREEIPPPHSNCLSQEKLEAPKSDAFSQTQRGGRD